MKKKNFLLTVIMLFALAQAQKKIIAYTTANDTNLKITSTTSPNWISMPQPVETQTCVFIDDTKTFQTYLGIGGALTDASAEIFYKMPKEKQQQFLTAYYNKQNGIGYTIARTNINSCDFSSDSYTYIANNDDALKTFDIAHDKKFKIPFIKEVIKAAGGNLTLFASPWSPPAFMKTNNDVLHGGHLSKKYYAAWANYYPKFIKSYQAQGINIWGITIQNEPMATQTWESCVYTADEEVDFLKNYLGPTMQKNGLANIKIIGWDHNRDLLYQRASTLLHDKEAAKYLWGIGYHWYEDWSGGEQMFENVKKTKEAFPDKSLLVTETCNYPFNYDKINDWKWAEKYTKTIINDFNNGTVGFTDWNVLLDEKGGPNHVGNYCFSPVHYNTQNGDLTFTNAFYCIGQFSKFIQPNAKRIVSAASRSHLLTTAFKNPDGTIVVVVLNLSKQKSDYFLWLNNQAAQVSALPQSVSTFIIKN